MRVYPDGRSHKEPSAQPTEKKLDDMSPPALASDEELKSLLERCAAADAAALRRLYDLVAPVLLACLTRILRRPALAEEALQDVFVSIWQRASQFQVARGRPLTWMMSIARYRGIDLLRRERHAPMLLADPPDQEAVEDDRPETSTSLASSTTLERCMTLLTAEQQRCLKLAFVEGHSHESIAQITGNPLGTVKSWIRRGLMSLRQCIEGRRVR